MKIKYVLPIILVVFVFTCTGCFFFKKKITITDLKSLTFSYSTGNAIHSNVRYTLKCDDSCKVTIKPDGISDEDKYETEVDSSFVKKVEDILNKYNVASWNGFSKSDKNVLDGDSFSTYINYGDNGYISASGYMMWPDNYSDVRSELNTVFMELYKENK